MTGFGTVERFGPATIARIKDWAGRSRVTIQPVLDMARTDAVDAHDPPAWMRELVILRDRHCVFPWCTRDARACDVDHITPTRRTVPGPNQARRPRRALPTTPPREDLPAMALPPHPVRQLPMDRTPRPDLPGHPDQAPSPCRPTEGRTCALGGGRCGRRRRAARRSVKATRGGRLEPTATTADGARPAGSPAQPTCTPHSPEPTARRSAVPQSPEPPRSHAGAPHSPEPTAQRSGGMSRDHRRAAPTLPRDHRQRVHQGRRR